MAVIGNAPFQGLVSGGEILDASIEGVDLSTSAIAARLGYTPVNPGAAAITAGTIDNTTIGATTAAAATVSTLIATGQTSLGGTAGAEGLRVTTTASAVNYVQIKGGATGNSTAVQVTVAGSDSSINLNLNPKGAGGIQFDSIKANYIQIKGGATTVSPTLAIVGTDTNIDLTLTPKGTGSVVVSSGNLGVGTASPTTKLHVLGTNQSAIFATTSSNLNYIEFKYNTNTAFGTIGNGGILTPTGGITDFVISSYAALAFATDGATERMRLDVIGNLGLGVTPNANWSTAFKALDIGFTGNSLVGFSASDIAILSGCYYQGGVSAGWKWSTTNSLGASYYEQYNGSSRWYISAPTAHTAGNPVAFTQAMTLDASGNLGVGTTVPTTKFHVAGTTNQASSMSSTSGTDAAIAETLSEIRQCSFNVNGGANFVISNIVTSAAGWRAVFRGTWSNNYEGGGLTPPPPYVEVNAANPSITVGSRTLTVSRNGSGYLMVNCGDAYNIAFTGVVEIYQNPQGNQSNRSMQLLGGITFPATQSASSNANTLDDYEEGTWTPALTTSGGGFSTTYSIQSGTYVKVGRLVTVWLNMVVGTKSASGSGYLQLTGLPFNIATGISEFGGSVGMSYLWSSNPCICIQPSSGTPSVILNYNFTNSNCSGTDITSGSYFRATVTYQSDA
jgi:hypothetical protein